MTHFPPSSRWPRSRGPPRAPPAPLVVNPPHFKGEIVNAVPTRDEQDEQNEQEAQHSGSVARVLDVVGRHVELVLMVAFGALVLIAVGVALATRSGGPAPSAPTATSSLARASSAQPAPSGPAAPPSPMPRPSSGAPSAAPAPASKPAAAAPPSAAASSTPAAAAPPSAAATSTPAAPAPKPAAPAPTSKPVTPAPTPKPATPVPAAKAPTSHTVVVGDTLTSIALRYQVGFEQIAATNGVADPRVIRPGQRLRIPERAASTIVIAPGDTLSGLARRLGTTVDALRALNPQITNPNRITAGGQLRVPRS